MSKIQSDFTVGLYKDHPRPVKRYPTVSEDVKQHATNQQSNVTAGLYKVKAKSRHFWGGDSSVVRAPDS